MNKKAKSDEEPKKDSQDKEAAKGSAAGDQPDRQEDPKEPESVSRFPNLFDQLKGKRPQSILEKIDQILQEITDRDDQSDFLRDWYRGRTALESVGSKILPTRDSKKVADLIIKANVAANVAAKAQVDLLRKELAAVVSVEVQGHNDYMNEVRATSDYFLRKNKGHIQKKLVDILKTIKRTQRREFTELVSLASGHSKDQKKQFENKVFTLIKASDRILHQKCTGKYSFKAQMLVYIRKQLKTL